MERLQLVQVDILASVCSKLVFKPLRIFHWVCQAFRQNVPSHIWDLTPYVIITEKWSSKKAALQGLGSYSMICAFGSCGSGTRFVISRTSKILFA